LRLFSAQGIYYPHLSPYTLQLQIVCHEPNFLHTRDSVDILHTFSLASHLFQFIFLLPGFLLCPGRCIRSHLHQSLRSCLTPSIV
jgi:hypothetical protein